MKKTLVSLAAASLIVTSAMAADKGIDIVTTGQAVIYYETSADNGGSSAAGTDESLFDQGNSQANVGVQLNLDADLGNNFTFGSQLSYLGTAGLEKNLVSGTKQTAGDLYDTTNELALSKIFVAKKVGNSTLKIGRQELPKSLSPLAFSEGWNVFKNTFEAILAVNTDIPDTTLVGAYVAKSNSTIGTGLGVMNDPKVVTNAGNLNIAKTAYMLTVANKSIPMTTLTASYYALSGIGSDDPTLSGIHADAFWLDAKVAGKDMPLGLKVGLQGGLISPDSKLNDNTGVLVADIADTAAYGIKVGLAPIDALSLCVAYTSVDGDDNKVNVAVKNTGTGVKTPLFTQMIYNQNAIALDADTYLLKAVYNTGDYGKVIAQYAGTSAGKSNLQNGGNVNGTDYSELDLIYKVKTGGVQYFASYIYRSFDKDGSVLAVSNHDASSENVLRFWARVAF